MNLSAEIYKLWDELERDYLPTISCDPWFDEELKRLDAANLDQSLTEDEWRRTERAIWKRLPNRSWHPEDYEQQPLDHLYGDFSYLIDRYLAGDAGIKEKVADADQRGKGFESLRYFLSTKATSKAYERDHVFVVCSDEGPHPHAVAEDVLPLPAGISFDASRTRYVVDLTRQGKRHKKTFPNREDAIAHRRQLLATLDLRGGSKSESIKQGV